MMAVMPQDKDTGYAGTAATATMLIVIRHMLGTVLMPTGLQRAEEPDGYAVCPDRLPRPLARPPPAWSGVRCSWTPAQESLRQRQPIREHPVQ
jgi:hypothetical protein